MPFDKTHPFLATLTQREVLNKAGSKKCTVHLSLDISGSDLQYKVGDSIGVFPENSPILVKETLSALKVKEGTNVTDPRTGENMSFDSFLTKKANLARVTKKWVQFICDHSTANHEKDFLCALLRPENKDKLKTFCEERQLWDFLKEIKSFEVTEDQCMNLFSPLLPRFYSIASSQKSCPTKIDLLIAYFKYTSNKHLRHGVASHYLCEMATMHSPTIPIYIHPSKNFTLPKDPSKPIIMIGPGTGVAPYRGFMQERLAQKASGKNWLFFGEWNKDKDYYYESFWEDLKKRDLIKLSLAFSRDQEHKIYVQHKLFENAPEVYRWIQDGAYLYVCGDAISMAKDVDMTLQKIIEEEGKLSVEKAQAFLKKLREEGRYLRDVY